MLVELKNVSYNTNNISPKDVYNTFVSLYVSNIICEKDKKKYRKSNKTARREYFAVISLWFIHIWQINIAALPLVRSETVKIMKRHL